MSCMCKQSYTSAWRKITGHFKFDVSTLYLIFKILYKSTKTRSIGEVVCELNIECQLDYHQIRNEGFI